MSGQADASAVGRERAAFHRVAAWESRGERIDCGGVRVWTASLGAGGATPVLVLHGFPTCSFDFRGVVDALPERRLVVLDFPGYGLSDKPESYGYSLFEQADVALQVARHHGLRRVHVLAHDMGTSVATELLARRARGLLPLELASVTFSNGSVFVELAHLSAGQRLLRMPRLGELFARLSRRALFEREMRRIFATPPSDEELDAMWTLLRRDDGHLRLPQTIRYVEERKRFAARWHAALGQRDVPTLVAWGLRDPIAVPAIADAICAHAPHARRVDWPELGHYPQVEAPARVAETCAAFWSEVERA